MINKLFKLPSGNYVRVTRVLEAGHVQVDGTSELYELIGAVYIKAPQPMKTLLIRSNWFQRYAAHI